MSPSPNNYMASFFIWEKGALGTVRKGDKSKQGYCRYHCPDAFLGKGRKGKMKGKARQGRSEKDVK